MRRAAHTLEPLTLALPAAAMTLLVILLAYAHGPLAAIATAAALAAVALAALRPLAVLQLAVAAIPLELTNVSAAGVFVSPTEALLVLAALGWSAGELAAGRLPVRLDRPLAKPLGAMLLATVPATLLAVDRPAALRVVAIWCVLYLIVQMIVADGRVSTVRRLLLILSVAAAATALTAMLNVGDEQIVGEQTLASQRATGAFLSPNLLASLLVLAMPAGLALGLRGPTWWRPLLLVAFALMLTGILHSLSRAGIVAGFAALAFLLVWPPLRRAALATLALVVVVGLVAGNAGGSIVPTDKVVDRLKGATTASKADPRREVWRHTLPVIATHPLFGVGPGNLAIDKYAAMADLGAAGQSDAGVEWHRFGRHAHNIVLTVTAELGIFGLAALVWLAASLLRLLLVACRRCDGEARVMALALAAAFVGLSLHGIVDYTLGQNAVAAVVMVLLGCAVVLAQTCRGRQLAAAPPTGTGGRTRPAESRVATTAGTTRQSAPAAPSEAVPVTFVSSHALHGGAELYLESLVERLGSEWVRGVVVLAEGPLCARLRAKGIPFDVVRTPARLGMVAAAARLRRVLLRQRPALVQAVGVKAALVATMATAGTRIPVSWMKVDYSRDGWLAYIIAMRCVQVIGISRAVTEVFGRPLRKKVRVVHCGIADHEVDRDAARACVLKLINRTPQTAVICHLGRLHERKGQLELVEALPDVLERHPEAHLVFVPPPPEDAGEQEHARNIVARAAELDVGSAITLAPGAVPPLEAIGGADVLAIPSIPDPVSGWREGFGLVAAEGMSVGTPVVAYADGALPEIIGDCGELVPTGDRTGLAAAIVTLLADPSRRGRLVECGLRRVERYRLSATLEKMKESYREAARSGVRSNGRTRRPR